MAVIPYLAVLEVMVFIAFWILLASAMVMLFNFYVCDGRTCKPFQLASESGATGSKDYTLSLVQAVGHDGIWPIPYIGATIATSLLLWFVGIPYTMKNYGLCWFTIFVTLYFMLTHFLHHYLGPIQDDIAKYIQKTTVVEQHQEDAPEETFVTMNEEPMVKLGTEEVKFFDESI